MFKFCIGVLIVCVATATPTARSKQNVKIVGGQDIDIADAPYQVSVLYRGRHTCGGTIVASDLIVTAAHCVGVDPNDYQIRTGSSSSLEGGNIYPVGDIVSHPDFSYSKMDNDVAVLWLSTPIDINDKSSPIDLLDEDEEIPEGEETIVTGWGHTTEGGGFPRVLQMVEVPIVSDDKCRVAYAPMYSITSRMLCAGIPVGGKDACQGDSGGPLVYDNKLAGIVSWGLGCARPEYPGVYAKVSALRPWIDESIVYLRLKHLLRAV